MKIGNCPTHDRISQALLMYYGKGSNLFRVTAPLENILAKERIGFLNMRLWLPE